MLPLSNFDNRLQTLEVLGLTLAARHSFWFCGGVVEVRVLS